MCGQNSEWKIRTAGQLCLTPLLRGGCELGPQIAVVRYKPSLSVWRGYLFAHRVNQRQKLKVSSP